MATGEGALPVVHEQVRHPQLLGVDAHLVDVAVLGTVPRQVVVRPVLSRLEERQSRVRLCEAEGKGGYLFVRRFVALVFMKFPIKVSCFKVCFLGAICAISPQED